MDKMRVKKALLINPPSGLYIREDRCQVPVEGLSATALRPPIDLAYISSVLHRAGVECMIRDYPAEHKGWDSLRRDIKIFRPDMLVISVTTPTLNIDMKACDLAKEIKPEIITVAKGAHFIVNSREVLETYKNLDVIIRNEPEAIIGELVRADDFSKVLGISYRTRDRIEENPSQGFIEDLDSIPFPNRGLLRNELYIRPDTGQVQTTIQANRGCPIGCIYCLAQPVSGNRIRARSPKNIVDEIEDCVGNYGIRNFFFRGDTFTWDKRWIIQVCKEILDRNLRINWVCNSRVDTIDDERLKWMKRSGCWLVSLGIESGSQDILDRIKKGIRLNQAREAVKCCERYRVKTFLFFMIGFPWDSKKTIKESIDFAKELDGDYYEVHIAVPFPGTELYKIVREKGLLIGESSFSYDHSRPALKTLYLSTQDLEKWRKKFLRALYLSPMYMYRTLKSCKSPRILLNHLIYGMNKFSGIMFKS